MNLNIETARKVLSIVDAGLVSGLGIAEPGKMCVEAAVCYALGEPHGDHPSCVGAAVRAFKIRLNDASWSSDEARTKGMRRVSIAQLGSDAIDQKEFRNEVALQTIKQIIPIALRAAASLIPAHKEALEGSALAREVVVDLAVGRAVARTAQEVARKARSADAAYADAAYAAAAADAADDARRIAARDSVLSKAAEIAVQALIKCGSQGCAWLSLCDEAKP